MTSPQLPDDSVEQCLAAALDARLAHADAALERLYPGDAAGRQPVHTAYVPADRYSAATIVIWSAQARAALDAGAGSEGDLARAWGVPVDDVAGLRRLVERKLTEEPVEDLRIDFEDGYGRRPDEDEDTHAVDVARRMAGSVADGTAARFQGIRVKGFEAATRRRGLRTLRLFLTTLVEAGGIPPGFVVTLPKVTSVDQVSAFAYALDRLERSLEVAPGVVRFELQVETPQAILGPDGTALIGRMIHEGAGRLVGLHYGTYDYSAALGVSAAHQSLEHPVADHAKAVMQVAAAGTGVVVADGSCNVLPVGEPDQVRAAWQLHTRLVRRSLARGIYQGWDLHPAQLPSRYAATYAFFRDEFPAAAGRLRDYVRRLEGGFLDEPATAAAMAGFLLRATECGALGMTEVTEAVGVSLDQLSGLSRRGSAARG